MGKSVFLFNLVSNWLDVVHSLHREGVMDWIYVSSQNSYDETLTPRVMVLEARVFGRQLVHEDRTLINAISAL
jgi:hypothetical protein